MLEELITRDDCAQCRICCQFEDDELMDAPSFDEEEKNYIKNNIDNKIKFKKKNNLYQIELIPFKNKHKCPLLSDHGCVLPNEYRPFDCESWPFYVMKKGNKYVITKSNYCPVFNKIKNEVLVSYIKNKFLTIAIKIVKEKPNLITKYNRDLEVLYEFEVDSNE